MNELIDAAKAVIEMWDRFWLVGTDLKIKNLRAAVERAESAQLAERERIKQIITYQFGDLVSDLDEVFAMIDDDSEHLPLKSEHLPAGETETKGSAKIEKMREALMLADLALKGANMNMNVVFRKVQEALKESE